MDKQSLLSVLWLKEIISVCKNMSVVQKLMMNTQAIGLSRNITHIPIKAKLSGKTNFYYNKMKSFRSHQRS